MNRVTFGLWGTTVPLTVVGLGGIVYVSLFKNYIDFAKTLT